MAPFWLVGTELIRLSIGGRTLPGIWKAVACGGGSTMAKARLRSAKASAALSTVLSETPGTSNRLKISTLSSEELAWKTGRNSAGLNEPVKPEGSGAGSVG